MVLHEPQLVCWIWYRRRNKPPLRVAASRHPLGTANVTSAVVVDRGTVTVHNVALSAALRTSTLRPVVWLEAPTLDVHHPELER